MEVTHQDNGVYPPSATVSIQRSTEKGTIDITVAWTTRGNQWFITHILDEDGNEAFLTKTEELMARCLVEAGVDETGR